MLYVITTALVLFYILTQWYVLGLDSRPANDKKVQNYLESKFWWFNTLSSSLVLGCLGGLLIDSEGQLRLIPVIALVVILINSFLVGRYRRRHSKK